MTFSSHQSSFLSISFDRSIILRLKWNYRITTRSLRRTNRAIVQFRDIYPMEIRDVIEYKHIGSICTLVRVRNISSYSS